MQQVLSPVTNYFTTFPGRVAEGWNAFWYTPVDPTLLGLIRIMTGLMLLYTHAVWGLALNEFFGPDSWISHELVDFVLTGHHTYPDHVAYSVWWLIPPRFIWPPYTGMMLILALFAVGLWTRITSVLALLVVISFVNRVPEALFGLDKVNVILTFYLTIGPSGSALSLDRWLARRRARVAATPEKSVAANFALRLVQVHMCIIYFFAGISKLQGAPWWNGEAMWLAFGNLEYQSADMTWLAWHPWMVHFLTHFAACWETSFCVLIWVPLLRPLVLASSIVMHMGIGACLGLWTFSLIMLVGCASFLPPEGVARLVAALRFRRAPNEDVPSVPHQERRRP
jgi:Vitamin K-dependent gamma-carboxylase